MRDAQLTDFLTNDDDEEATGDTTSTDTEPTDESYTTDTSVDDETNDNESDSWTDETGLDRPEFAVPAPEQDYDYTTPYLTDERRRELLSDVIDEIEGIKMRASQARVKQYDFKDYCALPRVGCGAGNPYCTDTSIVGDYHYFVISRAVRQDVFGIPDDRDQFWVKDSYCEDHAPDSLAEVYSRKYQADHLERGLVLVRARVAMQGTQMTDGVKLVDVEVLDYAPAQLTRVMMRDVECPSCDNPGYMNEAYVHYRMDEDGEVRDRVGQCRSCGYLAPPSDFGVDPEVYASDDGDDTEDDEGHEGPVMI